MPELPDALPTDSETGKPIVPRMQPGYYPGFSTLAQQKFWDATTRAVVQKRVDEVPPVRFFSESELKTISAACRRVLPQSDRVPERQIPIVNYIDERLFANRINGYRYEDMPPDQEAYRLLIQALDETAQKLHQALFHELDGLKQDEILESIHDGEKSAAEHIWRRMPIHRAWELLVGDCIAAYYAHPWAWDEIGFGGPAYPRAYMRLENGLPEPWEVDEVRYEWSAPRDSNSDHYRDAAATGEQSHMGQGGTH